MLRIALLLFFGISAIFVAFSFYVSQPVFDATRGLFAPTIADRSYALTFARTEDALILVSQHNGDALKGIDLTELYGREVTEDLVDFLETFDDSALPDELTERIFALDDLIMPLEYQTPSVAAGTNFIEHAEEIYSDDPPFLFPKLTPPGNWNESVPFVPRLDFEAEVCLFPLDDIDEKHQSLPTLGIVLCNDFTDRLTLIKEIDLGGPLGLTGFAAGKGCERCLPTGYLVVIPKSADFYRRIEVSLYVNDALKQRFNMDEMILLPRDMIATALTSNETRYSKGTQQIALLPENEIPDSTLLLTGTGAGVLFKPANIWRQGFYLQDGDTVRTEATFLGHLSNQVVSP